LAGPILAGSLKIVTAIAGRGDSASHGHVREGRGKGTLTESWSPLGRGTALLDDPAVATIAGAHGVTPGQVVLRRHGRLGAIPVPKSADPERQRPNLDVFGFELGPAQMAVIADRAHRRIGGDPETHEEF
jgi:diketogulonate reductase-like aldo/keto reductase